jgi:hypothetical protein
MTLLIASSFHDQPECVDILLAKGANTEAVGGVSDLYADEVSLTVIIGSIVSYLLPNNLPSVRSDSFACGMSSRSQRSFDISFARRGQLRDERPGKSWHKTTLCSLSKSIQLLNSFLCHLRSS